MTPINASRKRRSVRSSALKRPRIETSPSSDCNSQTSKASERSETPDWSSNHSDVEGMKDRPAKRKRVQPAGKPYTARKPCTDWTKIEDGSLRALKGQNLRWAEISKRIPGRSAQSCKARWLSKVRKPTEKPLHGNWKQQEEEILMQLREHDVPWKEISKVLKGRNKTACVSRYRLLCSKGINLTKAGAADWTEYEDAHLAKLIQAKKTWEDVANRLPQRGIVACLIRYYGHLKADTAPTIKDLDTSTPETGSRDWTKEEDEILGGLRAQNKGWLEISLSLPQRTAAACQNRYPRLDEYHPKSKDWTLSEFLILGSMKRRGFTCREISNHLHGRTLAACRVRSNHPDLLSLLAHCDDGIEPNEVGKFLSYARWTAKKKALLIVLWKHMSESWPFISKTLGADFCYVSVQRQSITEGLRFWTARENVRLSELKGGEPQLCWDDIAKALGRTVSDCVVHWSDGLCDAILHKNGRDISIPGPEGRQTFAKVSLQDKRRLFEWVSGQVRREPWDWAAIGEAFQLSSCVCQCRWYALRDDAQKRRDTGGRSKEGLTENEVNARGLRADYDRLLDNIWDSLGCQRCFRVVTCPGGLEDHLVFCNGTSKEWLSCVDCSKKFKFETQLIEHYRGVHSCDIRTVGLPEHFAETMPHLFPQLDVDNSYGTILTRRSTVAGVDADEDIKRLWATFTHTPAMLQRREEKSKLLNDYRNVFQKLFKTMPLRFHAHASDIHPAAVWSLVQRLLTSSSTRRTRWSTFSDFQKFQSSPNFACTYGTYGAAYGAGANTSLIQDFQETGAGSPYHVIETAGKDETSIEACLSKARQAGCFALVTEIVRWSDGRVMPVQEWTIIHRICRDIGMILVVDETLSLLRCGAPFAYQLEKYHGNPDLVIFGKGLGTAGIALDWNGSLSKGALDERQSAAAVKVFDMVSDVLETGILIRSKGLMLMALKETWWMRGLVIGRKLRFFASESNSNPTPIQIKGLGALMYFDALTVAHHGLQSSSAGVNQVRWLPVLDPEMEQGDVLQKKMFGPFSLSHRRFLGERMKQAGIIPSICSTCGTDDANGRDFCRNCCTMTCGYCIKNFGHHCMSMDAT